MSWTTSCPSPRLNSSISTRPSFLPDPLNHQPNCIRFSALLPSNVLLGLKAVSRCSEPAASPTRRKMKLNQSPPDLPTYTKRRSPQSSVKPTRQMKKQKSRPNPRSLLPQKPRRHLTPRQNLRQRRLRCFRITLTRYQSPSPPKTTALNDLLFRERFGWLVTSSFRAYRRRSHKYLFLPRVSPIFSHARHISIPTLLPPIIRISLFACFPLDSPLCTTACITHFRILLSSMSTHLYSRRNTLHFDYTITSSDHNRMFTMKDFLPCGRAEL